MTARVHDSDGGWWPPGHGEPGQEWKYDDSGVVLQTDDGVEIDVLLPTADGLRALCSFNVAALAHLFADHLASDHDDPR